MNDSKTAVFWMRRDLRLDDNHALFRALKSGSPVRIVFIYDKLILDDLTNNQDQRVAFISKRLEYLNAFLKDYGAVAHTFYGSPVEVFEKLLSSGNVGALFTNHDYEPYALSREKKVSAICKKYNVSFKSYKDQVIFEKDEIVKTDGKPYTVYTPYSRQWLLKYRNQPVELFPSEEYLGNLEKVKSETHAVKVSDFGFSGSSSLTVVAEMPDINLLRSYEKNRDFPAINGTTQLGHHLRFGTISIRKLVAVASGLSEVFLKELVWREFFMQILWHFPHVVHGSFKPQYDRVVWRNAPEDFERWKEGTTGYAMVDAGMRELRATGFMHNRVRMITAGFLVKHLLIDWRLGEAWFAEHLQDFELASNNGNWQWAAGSGCDAAPYFRIFNPYTQQKRFDPQYAYVKKWIPEYGSSAYPVEIVEHKVARERALEAYSAVLK